MNAVRKALSIPSQCFYHHALDPVHRSCAWYLVDSGYFITHRVPKCQRKSKYSGGRQGFYQLHPNKIWGVELLWWSIWLTICWAGIWNSFTLKEHLLLTCFSLRLVGSIGRLVGFSVT